MAVAGALKYSEKMANEWNLTFNLALKTTKNKPIYLLSCQVILSPFSCLHGKGEAVRNFLHVSDLAEAFDVILHRGSAGQIYNVGAADALSMHSLAKLLVSKVMLVSF